MAKWLWLLDDEGPGQIGDIVSHTAEVKKALNAGADKIGNAAAANLLSHRDQGDSHIMVFHSGEKSSLDAHVVLADDTPYAALSIEFGWMRAAEHGGDDDEVLERARSYGHGGLRILRNAAGL